MDNFPDPDDRFATKCGVRWLFPASCAVHGWTNVTNAGRVGAILSQHLRRAGCPSAVSAWMRKNRHIHVRWILLLTGLLFHAALVAEPVPSFTARYTLSRSGIIVGETIRTLSPTSNGEFIYQSAAHATGLLARFLKDEIVERSRWIYQNDGIRPLSFITQRQGGRKEYTTRQVFDWEKRVVTSSSNSSQLPLLPNTQDKLSYQILLMHDLKRGLENLEYIIAEKDKTNIYRFVIMGQEVLTTAIGTLHTLKIRRIGDERNTTVWCAIDRHYLPVKLEQTSDDDGHLELKIVSAQGL